MRGSDFISEARKHATDLWNALNALEALQHEWAALDYGNTMEDGIGDNEGYTASAVGSVVFATTDAIRALMNQGHATNVANLLTWLIICGAVINHLCAFTHVAFLT